MTQKQFDAIKAQINKTNKMIEDATSRTESGIKKRIDKIFEKIETDFPILVQTASECGMNLIHFETENFEGYVDTKTFPENVVSIDENSHGNMEKRVVYYARFPKDEEKAKSYFSERKENMLNSNFTELNLEKIEQMLKEQKEIQSAIRDFAIKFFQNKSNEKMKRLSELQAV